jgi:predicted permease
VLSTGIAERAFGTALVVGRTLRIDGEPHTVVGVMPRDFRFLDHRVELWLPLTLTERDKRHDHANNWTYIARLKPDATVATAQAQVDAVNAANLDRFPETRQVVIDSGFHSVVVPLQSDLVREIRPMLQLLWAGAAAVLLIGVLNVAVLAQARSQARAQEFATRLALGAARTRLLRQLVIEHLMLALAAAAAGLAAAVAALKLAGTVPAPHLGPDEAFAIDGLVLLYATAIALVVGAIIGTVPFLGILKTDSRSSLLIDLRTSTAARGQLLRRFVLATQLSGTFVLLAAAGLLLSSFQHAAADDLGFATRQVLTASATLPSGRYPDATAIRRFADHTVAAIHALPGVRRAGLTTVIPLGQASMMRLVLGEGYRPAPGETIVGSYRSAVSDRFFEAVGARLEAGRWFDTRDSAGAARSVIIDRRLARRFWPGQDPIGRRIYFPDGRDLFTVGPRTVTLEVVGVVGDLKLHGSVDSARQIGAYYLPFQQTPDRAITFAIATAGAALDAAPAVRAVVQKIDPQLPLYDVRTMEDRSHEVLGAMRLPAFVVTAFSVVALCLSVVGVYGALVFVLARRTREIGIRVALGSTRGAVFRLIAGEGLRSTAVGLAGGGMVFVLLRRALGRYLFGVGPLDAWILGGAAALLTTVAVIACSLPAFRAVRVDPARTLRCE